MYMVYHTDKYPKHNYKHSFGWTVLAVTGAVLAIATVSLF
ncbi:hypothetical protein SAMN02745723_105133 [Pragia fontium DSM 5563 = ATCC 49100]|uniref:Uncharacterized protein n=1 Tax=Pragia fontium DSM 5563 = ATCC 49100 TaxID=1122977 RepID=A0AAJ4WAV9_9GAMM|nr:hypothetical protein SAMN02745723_105133 [Pragia fontium DSM 5563 = ATCC 49100]